MVYTPDFSAISTAFTTTWTLGAEWLIPLAITFIAMALITRDMGKWKVLFFPITTLIRIMGMPVHWGIMLFGAIMFVLEILSHETIGSWIGTVNKWSKRTRAEEKELKGSKILEAFKKAKKQEEYLGKYAKKGKRQLKDIVKIRKKMGGDYI